MVPVISSSVVFLKYVIHIVAEIFTQQQQKMISHLRNQIKDSKQIHSDF